jgi:Uma2 family endonuclease
MQLAIANVGWEQFRVVHAALDEVGGLRMAYINGRLLLTTPELAHETIKKLFARLVETFALERGIELNAYGSMTFSDESQEVSLEPDECYSIGELSRLPDLAFEVVVTGKGIEKLEAYRRLGIAEVIFWLEGRLSLHVLRGDRYEPATSSAVLPGFELDRIAELLGGSTESQTSIVRAYRDSLRRPLNDA